ncbi:hypothetical protein [Thiocystis violascens]|uniref:Uncharacterized protein n=1 Tax=Thiocystis violascens (strain ATCC 17096 / DSM 198 / 6111) TaxID=765911 RepID=I3YFU9_THIV6|nr:hypothetical protein [Thiocystis violascens]AFL75867.1 hypothetical protein Thivi_4043 [Thiocystis violascens DSM 198]
MQNRFLSLSHRFAHAVLSGLMLFLLLQIGSINLADAAELMSPGKYKAPLKYALKLPKYCGHLYFGKEGAGYRMPSRELCGVGTNHFCGGLIALYQARAEKDRKKKPGYYRKAKKEVEYTKQWIADYPRCPLHPVVNNTLMEIDMALKLYK